MAAGSKPSEFLRHIRPKAQHADRTGPGLEFGRGTSRPGNGRSHERVVESIAGRRATLARFNLQPPSSSPGLQPADPRFVLLPAFAECLRRERLRRHPERRQFAQLQQPRLGQPWWWPSRPAITFHP